MKTLHFAALAALTICVQALAPAAADDMAFPQDDWEEAAPESQGVDAARLEAAVAWLKDNVGKDGTSELVVVRNGRLIWKGDNIDKVHGVWSLTKSFTSTALGLLIDDGKASLDTPAGDHVPALAADYGGVTLMHFTTMTSGYRAVGDEPRGGYLHGPSTTPLLPSPAPLFEPPGSQFAYWDSAMNQFGNVLSRVAGEPLEELLERRIADPIGINGERWDWGDRGAVDGIVVNSGSGNNGQHVQISAREAARFGHLFLNRGNWNGRQLISERWVAEATAVQVPSSLAWAQPESQIDGRGVYGYNWWVNGIKADGKRKWPGAPEGTFAGSGFNNNHCFVISEWKMVVVRLGLDGNVPDEVWSTFFSKLAAAIDEE